MNFQKFLYRGLTFSSLYVWLQTAQKEEWKHIIDVREVYPQADFVQGYTVFNIGGNKFRLITKITYKGLLLLFFLCCGGCCCCLYNQNVTLVIIVVVRAIFLWGSCRCLICRGSRIVKFYWGKFL
jgi:hypothetical protein